MGAAEIIPFNDKSYITLIPSESIQKLNMDSDITLNVDKDKIQNFINFFVDKTHSQYYNLLSY